MKKFNCILLTVLCALSMSGCSAYGDCVNCFTNGVGCTVEGIGCLGGSACGRMAACVGTCGVCGHFGGCYDCLTGYTCYNCGEKCRSHTVTDDTQLLGNDEKGFSGEGYHILVDKGTPTRSYVGNYNTGDSKNRDYCYKFVGAVHVTFEGEASFDNVRVECTLTYNGEKASSTRWIGTPKKKKQYTLDPTFYLMISGSKRDENETAQLTVAVYGERA